MTDAGPVSREEYQAQLQKIEELNQVIEGLFTNEIRHISWKEEVAKLTKEKEEAQSKYENAVAEYTSERAAASQLKEAEIEAMKSDHLLTVAKLEDAHADKLVFLTNKITAFEKEQAATEKCRLEEISSKDEHHQAQIRELVSKFCNSESTFKEEIQSLKNDLSGSENMRQVMLTQQEDEYEKEMSRQALAHQKMLEEKQQEIDDVNIQVQKLIAKKVWLERYASKRESMHEDVQNSLLEESQRCKILGDEIDRIKGTLTEKGDEIARLEAQISTSNAEKNHLEKQLYIVETRCAELEKERAPLEQMITQQKDKEEKWATKLGESQRKNDEFQRTMAIHEDCIKSKEMEIRSLRGTLRSLDRRVKGFEAELGVLAGISDEKLLKSQVKTSYRQFVKGEVTKGHPNT